VEPGRHAVPARVKRTLVLLPLLAGCATGPLSFRDNLGLSPVAHRATRGVITAGCVGTVAAVDRATDGWAAGCIIGQVAASKAVIYLKHPDWLGPWSPADWVCDLTWSASALPFYWLIRGKPEKAAAGAVAWLGAAFLIQRGCVP